MPMHFLMAYALFGAYAHCIIGKVTRDQSNRYNHVRHQLMILLHNKNRPTSPIVSLNNNRFKYVTNLQEMVGIFDTTMPAILNDVIKDTKSPLVVGPGAIRPHKSHHVG